AATRTQAVDDARGDHPLAPRAHDLEMKDRAHDGFVAVGLDLDVRDDATETRRGVLRVGSSRGETGDLKSELPAARIRDRNLTQRTDVVAVRRNPVRRVVVEERQPLLVTVRIHEARLAIEKRLDGFAIDLHAAVSSSIC